MVCIYLLESISLLESSLEPPRRGGIEPLLREHAWWVVEAAETTDSDRRDLDVVRRIYAEHFSG